MIAELRHRNREVADLCRRYGVRRLDVFGSATSDSAFTEHSDIDLLVEFAQRNDIGPADQYFGLLDALQSLLQRDVDLVSARGLRNPYFIESVNSSQQVLYAG